MKKIIFSLMLLPFLAIGQDMDQYVISSQGDYSESAEMSLSWTFGEFLTETAFMNDGAFTQGFQQSFLEKQNELRPDILEVNEHVLIDEERDLTITAEGAFAVNVFPNPGDGIFNVEIQSDEDQFVLEVLDASGKLVYQTQRTQKLNVLDLSPFENGLYMLRISNSDLNKSSMTRIIKM